LIDIFRIWSTFSEFVGHFQNLIDIFRLFYRHRFIIL
jgi:hypothetical protein